MLKNVDRVGTTLIQKITHPKRPPFWQTVPTDKVGKGTDFVDGPFHIFAQARDHAKNVSVLGVGEAANDLTQIAIKAEAVVRSRPKHQRRRAA